MIYAYPCQLIPDEGEGLVATFPDVPEAITGGSDLPETLMMAEDALATALAGYVHNGWDIPAPSEAADDQVLLPVPTVVAAKLALYTAMREKGITKVELSRRLGVSESAVRKLTNPDHRSHVSQVQKALREVGRKLNVEVTASESAKRSPGIGGFFEEFVGALFRVLGCNIEGQPPVNDRWSDYLATTPDGEGFYIEASVLRPKQFSEPRPAEEDVCRKLDEICQVPYLYWFWATASGELYQYLAKTDLDPIRRWMEGLSTQNLRPQTSHFSFASGTPPHEIEAPSRNWEIVIDAVPRSEAKQGIPDVLLAGFGRGGGIDGVTPLINKAREKVKQHKYVEKPVILAINDLADFPLDRIDMSVALFGCEQSAETGVSRITPHTEDLRRRSLWGRRENSTISGVLLFQRLLPGSMSYANLCLYENPWSRYPVPRWLTETLPHAYVEENQGIHYLCWPSDQRLSSILSFSSQMQNPSAT